MRNSRCKTVKSSRGITIFKLIRMPLVSVCNLDTLHRSLYACSTIFVCSLQLMLQDFFHPLQDIFTNHASHLLISLVKFACCHSNREQSLCIDFFLSFIYVCCRLIKVLFLLCVTIFDSEFSCYDVCF